MTPPLIVYHAGCNDGFCAAWLCRKAWPDAEFLPASYGDEPPDVLDRDVLVVDFTYPRPMLEAMAAAARSIRVLDHHKSAQADLAGLPFCTFDMEKSGARLAWEYLYGGGLLPDDWLATNRSGYSFGVAPWLVDYTEDRDLWRWGLPASRAVNAGLGSYDLDFAVWSMLHRRKPHDLAVEGEAIIRYQDKLIGAAVGRAVEAEALQTGQRVRMVNATCLQSEIGNRLAEGFDFAAVYAHGGYRAISVSLRSLPGGADVAEFARLYGGGGHARAAGMAIQSLTDVFGVLLPPEPEPPRP